MKLGNRIRQVLEISDSIGPARYSRIHTMMPQACQLKHTKIYCDRAVKYGLMTLTDGQYQAVEGWQDMREPEKEVKHIEKPFFVPVKGMVNSVFALGNLP